MEKPTLPLARTKKIVKANPNVKQVSSESTKLITHAAEFIIKFITEESSIRMKQDKKKTIKKEFIESVIDNYPDLSFLKDALSD